MNRKSLWTAAAERALRDREAFLDAYGSTGNIEVLGDTSAEIARLVVLRSQSFKAALAKDPAGVRVALIYAQSWCESLADAQASPGERSEARQLGASILALRLKLFGKSRLETSLDTTVLVPAHKIHDLVASSLSGGAFLATLKALENPKPVTKQPSTSHAAV